MPFRFKTLRFINTTSKYQCLAATKPHTCLNPARPTGRICSVINTCKSWLSGGKKKLKKLVLTALHSTVLCPLARFSLTTHLRYCPRSHTYSHMANLQTSMLKLLSSNNNINSDITLLMLAAGII